MEENNNIPTPAKIVVAEYHNLEQHKVYYKNANETLPHLIMHELAHLDLIIAARKNNENMLFTSDDSLKEKFKKKYDRVLREKLNKAVDKATIDHLLEQLFDGMNSRVYNAPIDLFIEDLLFEKFPALRPFQLLSLMSLTEESITAVTAKDIHKYLPSDLINKNKIYNIVSALQLKALYGIDWIEKFNANTTELKQAHDFYEEYLEYKENKEAAEEYELVHHWGEDLQLDQYFVLRAEQTKNNENHTFPHVSASRHYP